MTASRPTPQAVAEAAWRHLINCHDPHQALDELDGPVDSDTLTAVASQLRSHRHDLSQAFTEADKPQPDDQQELQTAPRPTHPPRRVPPHGNGAPIPSTTSPAR